MCGLVGVIGKISKTCISTCITNLEYRGYDSKGVALYDNDKNIYVAKSIYNTLDLDHLPEIDYVIGLVHCRWATHGKISIENTHPHTVGNVTIVHNGMIENIVALKELVKDYIWKSETDTEYLAYVLDRMHFDDSIHDDQMLNTICNILKNINGNYTFAFLYNGTVYAATKNMSLYLIEHDDYIAFSSDSSALSGKFVTINGYGKLNIDGTYDIYNYQHANLILPNFVDNITSVNVNNDNITLHEVYESCIVASRILNQNYTFDLSKYSKIVAIGSGSSYFACQMLELYSQYKVKALFPSELIEEPELLIVMSQSGETMDILHNMKGKYILGILNRPQSSIDLKVNDRLYCLCGIERGVAATKSVLAQMLIAKIICGGMITSISEIYREIEHVLHIDIQEIVHILSKYSNFTILGNGLYYPIALEASLKFIELTYVYVLGLHTNEFKHGYLALVDNNFIVIMLTANEYLSSQIHARGGRILNLYQYQLSELGMLVLMHRIAIELCLYKGLNLDKPRNLAKSLTVL